MFKLKNKGYTNSSTLPGGEVSQWQHSSQYIDRHNADLMNVVSVEDVIVSSRDSNRRSRVNSRDSNNTLTMSGAADKLSKAQLLEL